MNRGICFSQLASLWLPPGTIRRARFTRLVSSRWAAEIMASAVAGELYVKGVNLTLRIVRDGYHCEAAWEKEVPIFMDSLEL